jgi:hypothetical protein
MISAIWLPAVGLLLASGVALAGDWSGILVDSKCYAAKERSVSPSNTLLYVDRDRGAEIAYCSANKKTKSFGVVQPDGSEVELDAGGNAKAAELVRKAGKKSYYTVRVIGQRIRNGVSVDSISLARTPSGK